MSYVSTSSASELLSTAEDILILTHVRPDGDTAGSACALCLGLRSLGKTAYLAENPPSMRRYEKYMLPYFAPAGFIPRFTVAVDIPGSGQFPDGISPSFPVDLSIDHHSTNSSYAAHTLLDDHAAAAGELVYAVLDVIKVYITPDIAEALYVALATDTNGFRTASTTGQTLATAAKLHDAGFDVFALTRQLFDTKTASRLRLEAALFGGMTFPMPDVCLMTLPYSVITACGATEDDMDKLSLLTTVPEGVRIGLLLRQLNDGTWKVSLRTDSTVHAGEILRVIGGGGHPDAAGAVTDGSPEEISRDILRELSKKIRL